MHPNRYKHRTISQVNRRIMILRCYLFAIFVFLECCKSGLSLSASTTLSRRKRSSPQRNWQIEIRPAKIPQDLPKIRTCRTEAFVNKRNMNDNVNLLRPQQSFVNAESAVRGEFVCLVARERLPPCRILGTADVSSQKRMDGSYLVQNVFVVPEARGQGLAQRLVKGAERFVIANSDYNAPSRVSLCVETSNIPAVNLYLNKCNYQAKGINGILLATGQATKFPLLINLVKDLL